MDRKTVVLVFGGPSSEHEISLLSARNVAKALTSASYNLSLLALSKSGKAVACTLDELNTWELVPETLPAQRLVDRRDLLKQTFWSHPQPVFFPMVHGHFGEDGRIQMEFEDLAIPFVGTGVDGSVFCFHKAVTKKILQNCGVPVVPWLDVFPGSEELAFHQVLERLGNPECVFVKPAREGSSVGVSKVRTADEFVLAMTEAKARDSHVLIEKGIKGREIECSVLVDRAGEMFVSWPGEIEVFAEFYSYDVKYKLEGASRAHMRSQLDTKVATQIRDYAQTAFLNLECKDLARVDFFLAETGEIYLNEVNTMPGFTNISMYPKMLEATFGWTQAEIMRRLIG